MSRVAAVRHRRCRRVVLYTFHGFALWASPAVTHGVSPLGTVDEHVEAFRLPPSLHIAYSLVDALIHYLACLRPCISRIVCRHLLSSSAASTQRYSRLWRRRTASIEQPHKSTLASGGGAPCLTAGDARRVNPWRRGQRELRRRQHRIAGIEQSHKSTLASGGGAPCLTAGDARRVNPWKEDREKSDAGGVALQAWMEYILSPSQEKRNFCCHTIVMHCHTYNMHDFRYLYSQCDNVTTEKQTHKKSALPHTFPSLDCVLRHNKRAS